MGGNMGPVTCSIGAVLFLLLSLTLPEPADAYRDDWYGFVSFQDTSEWSYAYYYTCHYQIDLFREPRQFSKRNDLKPREELQTPIRFFSRDTKPADSNTTLHIYNNPGIRKGYSVSYGFQRNKECLHGQDSECVVFPEIGRVRAVVVNAERFTEKQNLNFVKDHFLIERPERFVTILNGGSIFERKFYEAIFLGGYPNHPSRTSHEIDGISYPLEIYMYFLDETVPSVSLSTILVVLVEESSRDNPHIKPITNAIENRLYDKERRFLDHSKAIVRRERMFHHLKGSVVYNVYDSTQKVRKINIVQDPLETSVTHESQFTRYVEVFEKMQALEAEMFFLAEDFHRVTEEYNENLKFTEDLNRRRGNELFPANNTELQLLSITALLRGYVYARNPEFLAKSEHATCKNSTEFLVRQGGIWDYAVYGQFKDVSQVPTGTHLDELINLITEVCGYFDGRFIDLHLENVNDTVMPLISRDKKYELIEDWKEVRLARDKYNWLVYEHFHNDTFHPYNPGDEKPDYKDDRQPFHLVDAMYDLVFKREKRINYKKVLDNTAKELDKIVDRLGYDSRDSLHEVTRYLKYGSKQNDLNFFRAKVHDEFVHRTLPVQQKKRGLVELGGMEMNDADIFKYEELDPEKVIVNEAFQISWLIPPDGGYYFYQGSSPVPPCFRAQNVIVFKRPISMSKRQINLLTRIPTSFDRAEDVQYTTPHIHDTVFEVELSGTDTSKSRLAEVKVEVFNQRRNHLFLGHDGVHKNAVDEWEKIKDKKRGRAVQLRMSKEVIVILMFLLYTPWGLLRNFNLAII